MLEYLDEENFMDKQSLIKNIKKCLDRDGVVCYKSIIYIFAIGVKDFIENSETYVKLFSKVKQNFEQNANGDAVFPVTNTGADECYLVILVNGKNINNQYSLDKKTYLFKDLDSVLSILKESRLSLTDFILTESNYLSYLKEALEIPETFDDFIKILNSYKLRLEKCGIKSEITQRKDAPAPAVQFIVKAPKNNLSERCLRVLFISGDKIVCDKTCKFPSPGFVNLNTLNNTRQLIGSLDRFVRDAEKATGNNNSNTTETPSINNTNSQSNKSDDYKLDDSVERILSNLKSTGENWITRVKRDPGIKVKLKHNGQLKELLFKVGDCKLYASTERELIGCIEYPRDLEIFIYNTENGKNLRKLLIQHLKKDVLGGKTPEFRYDMKKNPYLYFVIDKLPVKNASGPEAKAILNYFDGNKVRFQPRGQEK